MIIRKSTENDIKAIEGLYASAREFMRRSGNPNQWGSTYPPRERIVADISEGSSYVVVDGDEILAVFYFMIGADPTYERIYEGRWLSDEPYAVIHRVAVGRQGCGIARTIFDFCFERYPNLRIDTHRDNLPMQGALLRSGFSPCGVIYLESGEERLAYQKIK
ncbi:MAG: N-acetyltransferase [Clostridia bacterium]|nr:N-acetyltransferase [Clostridia bacterium]